jgi:hypothetical protein
MLFSNLLVAIALTVLFPLGLMGMLAASEWLERRTLAAEELVPRPLRRMDSKPPEAVEAMVLEETAPANGGGRHLRRAAPGRAGRHERRR